MITEPRRLFDTGGELGQAIGAARRKLPSREQLRTVADGLARAGIALPEPATASLPAPAPMARRALVRWLGLGAAGAVAAAVVAGGALLGSRRVPPPARSASPTATLAPPARRAPIATDAPAADPPLDLDALPPPPATSPSSGADPTSAAREPSRSLRQLERAEGNEIELLKRARNALAEQPAETLALVEQARRRFPRSAFGQEREFLTIAALARLGRADEARLRERAFRAQHPRSAYLPQLDRLSNGP